MTLNEISLKYGVDAKLLKQYFLAFSNLYGICSLQKAMQIINRQNPGLKLRSEQLLAFADNYIGDWKIIAPDEVYLNAPVTVPMRREIVNKLLVYYNDYGGYDYVRSHQADKDFYIPAKDELLNYAKREYFEATRYTYAMAQFLQKKLRISDWQRKLLEIEWNIRLGDFDVQAFIDTIDSDFPDFEMTQEAINLYTDLHNNTRLMLNRGYTASELFRRYNPQGAPPKSISFGPGIQKLIQSDELNAEELTREFNAMDISPDLRQSLISEINKAKQPKPGRNDPCPCGSGKKYKKCCGR